MKCDFIAKGVPFLIKWDRNPIVSWILLYELGGWLLRAALAIRVLGRRRTPASAMAWLILIFLHPVIGLIFYMLLGSTRLEQHTQRKHGDILEKLRASRAARRFQVVRTGADPSADEEAGPVVLQIQKISGMPLTEGNAVKFIAASNAVIDALVADINAAQCHVHVMVYIFAPDDTGRKVAEALINAAKRGVSCRLLVDAIGSHHFLRSRKLIHELREAGVEFSAALPIAPLSRKLARIDLRNHRKLVIIDNTIAYTGSQNIINEDYGGRRGNPWFDLMGRFTGPVVADLQIVFLEDWAAETGLHVDSPDVFTISEPSGDICAQVIDTSPSQWNDSFRRALIAAFNAARKRIITTTPYFVIDEPTMLALSMAADRGVEVNIVLPRVGDHLLAAMAGCANFLPLLESGVKIHRFRPGLLHAKTTTIDEEFALIGSANLDLRSFNLDFELSVMLYGKEITAQLRDFQLAYIAQSDRIDINDWRKRKAITQYAERAIALLSPLL